jgi:hypothetical protein
VRDQADRPRRFSRIIGGASRTVREIGEPKYRWAQVTGTWHGGLAVEESVDD